MFKSNGRTSFGLQNMLDVTDLFSSYEFVMEFGEETGAVRQKVTPNDFFGSILERLSIPRATKFAYLEILLFCSEQISFNDSFAC